MYFGHSQDGGKGVLDDAPTYLKRLQPSDLRIASSFAPRTPGPSRANIATWSASAGRRSEFKNFENEKATRYTASSGSLGSSTRWLTSSQTLIHTSSLRDPWVKSSSRSWPSAKPIGTEYRGRSSR